MLRKKLPKRIQNKVAKALACFLAVCFFSSLEVQANSGEGGVTITAVVAFTQEFGEALSENSKVFVREPLNVVGRGEEIVVVISNGVEVLRNQDFSCEVLNKNGEVRNFYQGRSGKDGTGLFTFEISTEMVGINTIKCQAIGYEKEVYINKQANFFAIPTSRRSFDYLVSKN